MRAPAVVCVAALSALAVGDVAAQAPASPRVVIETSEGDITCELFRDDVRVSVVNFLAYVPDGLHEGTIFHRVSAPHSARAQFFINTENNASLDHRNQTDARFGCAVFGRVTDGMDVVTSIERTRTRSVDGMRDVPREPIVIHRIRRLN